MRKYIADENFKYKNDANDMTHREFYLSSVEYVSSENSTMNNLVLDMSVTYVMFLKSIEVGAFRTILERIVNSANADGLCAALGNAISVEKQENGYMVTMNFIIEG